MKNLLLIFVAVIVLAAVLLTVLKQLARGRGTSGNKLPYRKKDYLLTAAERSFYEVLRSIASDEVEVFAKVRLLDLVYLPASGGAAGDQGLSYHYGERPGSGVGGGDADFAEPALVVFRRRDLGLCFQHGLCARFPNCCRAARIDPG